MTLRRLSILIAFASSALFSLLYFLPFFRQTEDRVYDLFLRFSPKRQRIDNVIFLDIDDEAIAEVGVFPWPRSVVADGLLKLKEYGAEMALFDIEYIDKSPTQVDEIYLKQGLGLDYNRHFSEIGTTVADILNAVSSGLISRQNASSYIGEMTDIITKERNALYEETLRITRDDDLVLAQAAALFGSVWGTLHVQNAPLSGEQAQRRPLAEKLFSYPVNNQGGITEGINIDILPAVPLFSNAVRGAGYTNMDPDPDGVRRRIFLTQEVQGYWYLQLAFAPLMHSWGNPDISVQPRRFIIDKPDGKVVIPLDENGAMLLDWPPLNYMESFTHLSFNNLSILDKYLANIEEYLSALAVTNEHIFPVIVKNTASPLNRFSLSREAKRRALEECSEEAFNEYLTLRNQGIEQTADLLDFLTESNYIDNQSNRIINALPAGNAGLAGEISGEAEYCHTLADYIDIELKAYNKVSEKAIVSLNGKTCIIGRVDTGTTDIGVNPFFGQYINVGTHAVVLDTIISNSFITPIPFIWSMVFTMLFVPFIIIGISGFKPTLRAVLGTAAIVLAFGLPLGLFVLRKIYLGPLGAVLASAVAVILREVFAFSQSDREKQFIRRAFSTYLSPGVVAQLIADPSKLNLGGEKREMTVIFTDIAKFSSISESLDPTQLVRMLNRYLTTMSDIIMDNRGTIDKYEGDAIIAFFGAPIHMEDHAALACRSALEMKKAEGELNSLLLGEGLSPSPIFTRIGINSGEMVVGNMGADNKMDYTVMGNAVNLGSRLEGVNKQYNTGIIISESTREKAGDFFLSRRLDRVQVVGIHTPVLIHELTGMTDKAGEKELAFSQKWKNAIDHYEQRRFSEALDVFSNILGDLPNDYVASQYVNRCITYIRQPPGAEWDGVVYLNEK